MKWSILILFLFIPFGKISSKETIPAAYLIADQIKKGLDNLEDRYISALISGIEAREKNIPLSSEELGIYPLYVEKQRALSSQKNLGKAENWIKCLEDNQDVHFIIPSKLAYSLVKKGAGDLLTRECGKVSVNYTVKKSGDIFPETLGREEEINLSEVISGLSQGMLSMREGEVRTLYIHPELAYQTQNFDPSAALEITVELLRILPDRIEIPSLSEIPHFESTEVTQDELDRLQLIDHYVLGWKLWDHLRWGYKLFTQQDLISFLRKEPFQNLSSNYHEEINKIHWQIYQQRSQDE